MGTYKFEWDLFISYASDDKPFVRKVAKSLEQYGLSVWFDETELKIGDSLREAIDFGLSRSEFGVVILSHMFFKKDWPQKELNALVAREDKGKKVILPVWHKINADDVKEQSPILADKHAISSSKGAAEVASQLYKAIRKARETGLKSTLISLAEKLSFGNKVFESSVFATRAGQFMQEKSFLAEKFTPLLLGRCRFLSEEYEAHIYLLADGGTTVYPFFRLIADEAVLAHASNEQWIRKDKFTIVTNNLVGIEAFMMTGRLNPTDAYSVLVADLKILPGSPLPSHSSVTGDEAIKALEDLKQNINGHNIFIGLTSGAHVRITSSSPSHPIPATRMIQHFRLKEKMLQLCDEVFVISPEAKLILGEVPASNQLPKAQIDDKDSYAGKYHEVILPEHSTHIKLVSTWSGDKSQIESLRHNLNGNIIIADSMNKREFVEAQLGDTSHLIWRFRDKT